MRAIKVNINFFELISCLKINFHKSLLVGVNVSRSWSDDNFNVLNCRVSQTPFTYLLITLGGNPQPLSFWIPLIDKIMKHLSDWKICIYH